MRIVLMDDCEITLVRKRRALSHAGFDVHEYYDPSAGLDDLVQNGFPDALILDTHMLSPEDMPLHGYQLALHLHPEASKARQAFPDLLRGYKGDYEAQARTLAGSYDGILVLTSSIPSTIRPVSERYIESLSSEKDRLGRLELNAVLALPIQTFGVLPDGVGMSKIIRYLSTLPESGYEPYPRVRHSSRLAA